MKHVLRVLFFLIPCLAFSQTQPAPWLPQGADLSYPRTLLRPAALPALRDSLAAGVNNDLLNDIYTDAQQAIPVNNDIDDIHDKIVRADMAKNNAFIFLLGVKPSGNGTAALSLTEKNAFKNKAISLLEQLNPMVHEISTDSVSNYDLWQWNSKEIIEFLSAYDLLKGGGATDAELANAKTAIKTYVGNLYHQASKNFNPQGGNFFQIAKNNHALMTGGAIGLAAVVLNDLTDTIDYYQPTNWINAAMWNIHNVLWWDIRRQSAPGGHTGYAEGTYYFKYGFMNLLPFIRSMGNFAKDTSEEYSYLGIPRRIRNPWYDSNYVSLFDWFHAIRLPDGRLPSIEDSYTYRCFPELSVMGNSKYNWPLHLSQLDPQQYNSKKAQLVSVYDFRANYIAANVGEAEVNGPLFNPMPDAGVAVWRSGWDSTATYFALTGKHGTALDAAEAHNQADDGAFMMMVNGQMMALSPGYLSYEWRDTVARATAHNMLLVDGAATLPGIPGSSNGSECYIEKHFSSNVQSFAELRTNYQDADINRKVLFVRNKYFLLIDHLHSTTGSRQFSWLLHGYGLEGGDNTNSGVFTDLFANNRAAWKRRNSGLYAIVNSDRNLNLLKKTGMHEYLYQTINYHTYLEVQTAPASEATYATCLQPFKNLGTDTIPVGTLQFNNAVAYKVNQGGYTDLLATQSLNQPLHVTKTQSGLNRDYHSDAQMFWASDNASGNADLFVHKASYLLADADTIFTSAYPINIQYVQTGAKTFQGYCGDTGWIEFHTGEYPVQFDGTEIWARTYDQARKVVSVYFSKACSFSILLDDSRVGINEATKAAGSLKAMPNPANDVLSFVYSNGPIARGSIISLYDLAGKLLLQQQAEHDSKQLQLNVASLEPGIYLARLSGAAGQPATLKIAISR